MHIKKGELTQEEKELLEVIGKGMMGAGLPRRRCQAGLGALSLGCGSARLAAPHRDRAFLSVVCRGAEGGRQGEALPGRARSLQRGSSFKSALAKEHSSRLPLGL